MKNTNKKSILFFCFWLIMLLSASVFAQSGMQIFVKTDAGQIRTFDVYLSDSIENLKTKVQERFGVATDRQRLFFVGTLLQDGNTLADYNIQHESFIHLVVASQTLTVTHKRDIKLVRRLLNTPHLTLNDSGLGATDLDQTQGLIWMHRYIACDKRFYRMYEKGDGTAYFGNTIASDIQATQTGVAERHLNPGALKPEERSLFGIIGLGNRLNVMNHSGKVLDRWLTGLPSARSIVYGGGNTSIVFLARSNSNGVSTRLASIDHNIMVTSSISGDVMQQTGKNIGEAATMAYGADDMLYLFDLDNLRILKFDTGMRGGTRGAFLGTFDLDPNRPAINSMTMDLAGNFYVGNGREGFNIYSHDGQWLQNVEGIYRTDPESNVPSLNAGYLPNMNYYASGLNDGNGTVDVRDATGYRQYNIIAPGQVAPIKITSEPQSQATCLLSPTNLSVAAFGNGASLTYQWRKDGVDLTDGGTISGATTANLSISSTVAGDAGYYDVLVRRPNAIVTSQAAIITVTPTPIITMQPVNQSIGLGDDATFTATANHAPGVQWQVSTDGGATFTDISGATNETLILPAVNASQIGNYYRAVFSALCGNSVTSSAAFLKFSQTINFANPGAKNFGDPAFDLGGTASSDLPVSYTVVFGPAIVSGSMLTITNSGIVSIKASQSGNAFYNAAPDVTQTFTVMRSGDPSVPFVVDTISDDVALSACTSAPSDCSLRAAVLIANSSASDDTINFDASLANQVIVLNSQTDSFAGQLTIADNGALTINGLGMNQLTISGNNTSRVFFIEENAVAAISNLTATSGKGGGYDSGYGGGIYNNVNGNLTLTNVTVSNSSSPRGGGIYSNNGTLRLIRSTVSGNSTGGGKGGGIFKNDGTLTITDSTVSGNSTINSSGEGAGDGGGIHAFYGATTISNSTISGNRALGTNSGGGGGGIHINGGGESSTILINSTISDNKAGAGGGVYINNFDSAATMLTNMTVTDNLNKGGTSTTTMCGGVYNAGASAVNVSNSIIAKNGVGIYDVTGPFISGGYNLIGNIFTSSSHRATGFGATGDKFGTNGTRLDAGLLPLNFYGGATKTHTLAADSPAIDAGNSSLTIDQRNFVRPFDNPSITNAAGGNGADIGAIEMRSDIIQVSLPTGATSSVGSIVTIPVTISGIPDDSSIESFDFSVFYNPSVLQPAAPFGSNAGTLSANCSVSPDSPISGRVNVSGVCAQAITPESAQAVTTGSGVLYNLTFNVIGTVNQTSSLSFINPANNTNMFQINNIAQPVSTTDGQFTVLSPTAANASVSGRVLTSAGRGLTNAFVVMTDASGNIMTARTGSFGYFHFDDVEAGQTYIVSVRSKSYSFAPQIVTVMEDLTELNFTAQ